MASTLDQDVATRRWSRSEYDRLIELGMFVGEKLELLDGLLVVAEPQGSSHMAVVVHIGQLLNAAFGPGWHARLQGPLALDDASEPEPDVAIVTGAALDYRHAHPTTAALVVEVAESSLRLDRRFKAALYARAGLQEYWIVNLHDRALEIYRDPQPDHQADLGAAYRSVEIVRPPAVVNPLAAPHLRIDVAQLL